eukprot:CAMPEP_0194106508 /NCGR_PEP_ID=MMETSP0150-20130528/6491_1 /TAXON_ID=122233 /ORGANISM="Chaetoceros debilis, Strain MM31A-1" /LENGTH=145 /DNA_ID=CAMNT_0038794655 /DNA_START=67 /DNA_END=504 /DNA_ORIENTATION=+
MVKRYHGVNKLKSSGGSLLNLSNLASAVQDRRHFPKAVVGIVLSSALIGYGLMTIIDKKRERSMHGYDELRKMKDTEMSRDESLLRAMIDTAKKSTAKENLENAAMAQKNFVLGQFNKSETHMDGQDQAYLQRIAKRSDQIRNDK